MALAFSPSDFSNLQPSVFRCDFFEVFMLLHFFLLFARKKSAWLILLSSLDVKVCLESPCMEWQRRRTRSACFLWGGTRRAASPATATEPSPAAIQLLSLWMCQDPAVIPGNERVEMKCGIFCGSCPSLPSIPRPDWTCGMLILKSVENCQRAEIPLTSVSFSFMPETSVRTYTRRQSLKSGWNCVFLGLAMVVPQRHTGNISYSIILNSAEFISIQ